MLMSTQMAVPSLVFGPVVASWAIAMTSAWAAARALDGRRETSTAVDAMSQRGFISAVPQRGFSSHSTLTMTQRPSTFARWR